MRAADQALSRTQRALGLVLKLLLWFVVPLLLALVLRAAVLRAAGSASALAVPGEWAERWPVPFTAAAFVVFAVLTRYWSSGLPLEVAEKTGERSERARMLEAASFVALLGVAALAALGLRGRVVEVERVLSSSMLPSLEAGSFIATNKLAYTGLGRDVKLGRVRRGDVVVFDRAGAGVGMLVKRVIGLPGDRIETHGGLPVINGWEVPSCDAGRYLYLAPEGEMNGRLRVEMLEDRVYLTLHVPGAQSMPTPYVVKPDEVFVLGDNRNRSQDSRVFEHGEAAGLALAQLRGRVDWILWSHDVNDDFDVSQFSKAPDMALNLRGVATSDLERGIERCLAARPKNTYPPRVTPP